MVRMYKLIATDVDGVVKPYYDPVPRELSEILLQLSKRIKIVFLSGRQISWLEGLVLGMGLRTDNTVLIGEEGAVILFPREYDLIYSIEEPFLSEFIKARDHIRKEVLARFTNKVFIPATHIILTIAAGSSFDDVDDLVKEIIVNSGYGDLIKLTYHRMHNVIQVFPKTIDKYVALSIVLERLNVSEREVIALGDGLNDIPILEKAGLSIAVGENEDVIRVSKMHFLDGLSAFKYVNGIIK